ncbi:MAG: PilZ domain-containing protein [Mariprofundus sp.]|nr:PilZ domain-containing protein [Mariprofundus sp.]
MRSHHNLRDYSRSTVAIRGTLSVENGKPIGAEVLDLSMSGIFVRCGELILDAGCQCQISILFGHFKHELPMIVQGSVTRSNEKGIAIKFHTIQLESATNLKHLITMNAQDPEQIELEYSRHGGWIFTPDGSNQEHQ